MLRACITGIACLVFLCGRFRVLEYGTRRRRVKLLPSTFNAKPVEKRVVRPHTQLKEVDFSGFRGTQNEYNLMLYILKNAVFLERLSVSVDAIYYHVNLEGWHRTTHCSQLDYKKIRRIVRERLQREIISKDVEINIV
ncbi:uncharacterized protein LOC142551109 isoform X2 [Primulina tabacum]|uniref:uncharacterized protein LOC142551109 isoform X2 n=1 Tax=Primulina tabacum TaxID=48773 RepID=UPI003F59FE2C